MYCPKCGIKNQDSAVFCIRCGSKIIEEDNEILDDIELNATIKETNNLKIETDDIKNSNNDSIDAKAEIKGGSSVKIGENYESTLRAYIVENDDYYISQFKSIETNKKANVNWTWLIGGLWLLYRRMYAYFFLTLIPIANIYFLINLMINSNKVYYEFICKKIKKDGMTGRNIENQDHNISLARKHGGTSPNGIALLIAISLIIPIVIYTIIMSYFSSFDIDDISSGYEKYIEERERQKEWNNNLESDKKSDSSLGSNTSEDSSSITTANTSVNNTIIVTEYDSYGYALLIDKSISIRSHELSNYYYSEDGNYLAGDYRSAGLRCFYFEPHEKQWYIQDKDDNTLWYPFIGEMPPDSLYSSIDRWGQLAFLYSVDSEWVYVYNEIGATKPYLDDYGNGWTRYGRYYFNISTYEWYMRDDNLNWFYYNETTKTFEECDAPKI